MGVVRVSGLLGGRRCQEESFEGRGPKTCFGRILEAIFFCLTREKEESVGATIEEATGVTLPGVESRRECTTVSMHSLGIT